MNSGSSLKKRWIWIFGLSLLTLFVSGAFAQPRDATTQKLEAIRERMERGQALYLAGNYAEAAQTFESGFSQYPYSAFLFNAGVCYQKLNDIDRALASFNQYLTVDPTAPDHQKVKARIEALAAAKAAAEPPPPSDADAGSAGGAPADADAGSPAPAAPPPVAPVDDRTAMKSLVVIETEPAGAPLKVFVRVDASAQPFRLGTANAGWQEVVSTRSPASLTLEVGRYHVLVEKFRDFNESQADIDVSPGHVHHFKANLSQGEFMAFLRVTSPVRGAYLYLDDAGKKRPPWGVAPHGELVGAGKHTVLVEAPGFEPFKVDVELAHGEQREMQVDLVRVGYGVLRFDSNAPEITVRIDEQLRGAWRSGEAPLDVQLPSGKHRIRVEGDGRKTFEAELEVPRGQVLPVHVKLIPKYPRGAAWTEAVLSAAFLGTGIYLGLESDRLHDELEQDRRAGVLEQGDSRISKGRWFSIGANAGFAIGGALGLLATFDFIKDPLPESSMKLHAPVEFDDPLKKRPSAVSRPRPVARGLRKPEGTVDFEVGATPRGLTLGGRF
ncbi:MAG TPA: PEGA domain-containing protein [Polyangiaceae bacterium]